MYMYCHCIHILYICVYAYIYTHILYVYIYMHIVCIYIHCMYTYVYRICIYCVYIYTCIFYMYSVHLYIYMHCICILYVYIYNTYIVCVCMYMYMCYDSTIPSFIEWILQDESPFRSPELWNWLILKVCDVRFIFQARAQHRREDFLRQALERRFFFCAQFRDQLDLGRIVHENIGSSHFWLC